MTPSVEAYESTHPQVDQAAENERMKDLNPRFVKNDINGTGQSSCKGQRVGPGRGMKRGDYTF